MPLYIDCSYVVGLHEGVYMNMYSEHPIAQSSPTRLRMACRQVRLIPCDPVVNLLEPLKLQRTLSIIPKSYLVFQVGVRPRLNREDFLIAKHVSSLDAKSMDNESVM